MRRTTSRRGRAAGARARRRARRRRAARDPRGGPARCAAGAPRPCPARAPAPSGAGGDDERQHADAADAGEPRLVGHASRAGLAKRSRCTGAGKPMPGARDRGCRARASRRRDAPTASRRAGRVGDARAVVGDRHLDGRLLRARPRCASASARSGRARRGRPGRPSPGRGRPRACGSADRAGEDLLGHRAGRIPGSCAHGCA